MPSRIALCSARMRLCTATIAVALAGCFGVSTTAFAAASAPVLDPQEQAACQLINQYRAARGLPALKVSAPLTRAAKWMSKDMSANDYIDHTDSRGRGAGVRLRTFGFRGATMGENLAGGKDDALAAFNQWKASAAHRRVMLRANYRVIGLGRAYGSESMLGWYWTAAFGAGRERGVAC